MIIEKILDMFFSMISFIIQMFPTSIPSVILALGALVEPIQYACYYFGADVLALIIGHIIGWSYIYLGWICFEWLYKKIPGVN